MENAESWSWAGAAAPPTSDEEQARPSWRTARSNRWQRLRRWLPDTTNTGSGVWADSAYRSKKNEAFVDRIGLVSHIH